MGIDRPTPGDAARQEAALVKKEGERDLIQESIKGLNDMLVEARKRGENLGRTSFGNVDVSIQAGSGHYCEPRSDDAEAYTEVELGFPSEPPPDYIMEYAEDPSNPTETVYAYVPIEKVARWASEKGGAKALPAPEKEGE